ncbi:hypothetical protein ACFORG_23195 [Lutimaribacter marinistellae]|uniref:Uncharacterized protein n=1 Tax=Lutimaribacter marinistellae TaxID=1820329 RepID=A0ABV7TQK3_9RHOB
MFLELIGTVFAGIAVAGLVMLLGKVTGGRLPRWMTPVAAGLAMIAVTISSEYSWFSRTTAALPEGLVVAQTVEKRAFYQPWTYVTPYVNRFVAADIATMQSHPERPDQKIAQLYFFGRWAAVEKLPVAFDCAENRRAMLGDGVEFDAAGELVDADWVVAPPGDPLVQTVCEVA